MISAAERMNSGALGQGVDLREERVPEIPTDALLLLLVKKCNRVGDPDGLIQESLRS